MVSFEQGGKPIPEEFIKKADLKLVFSGDKANMKKGGKDDADEPIFALDTTKTPKTIDVTDTKGKNKGKTQKGIYTFEGDDTLKIAMSGEMGERPTSFKTKEGSKFMVIVLKAKSRSNCPDPTAHHFPASQGEGQSSP